MPMSEDEGLVQLCAAKSAVPGVNLTLDHPFHSCHIPVPEGHTHLGKHVCFACGIDFIVVEQLDPEATLLSLDNIGALTQELPKIGRWADRFGGTTAEVPLLQAPEDVASRGDAAGEDRTPPDDLAWPATGFGVPADVVNHVAESVAYRSKATTDEILSSPRFTETVEGAYRIGFLHGQGEGRAEARRDRGFREALKEIADAVDAIELKVVRTFNAVYRQLDRNTGDVKLASDALDAHRDKLIELDGRLTDIDGKLRSGEPL
jgi:hypothetical protein